MYKIASAVMYDIHELELQLSLKVTICDSNKPRSELEFNRYLLLVVELV